MAKFIKSCFALLGVRRMLERKVNNESFSFNPSYPNFKQKDLMKCSLESFQERELWTVCPSQGDTLCVGIYLHGGAFMAQLNAQHWDWISSIVNTCGICMIVPNYPLAPQHDGLEVLEYLDLLYQKIQTQFPNHRLVLMGDSAGAGLALSFSQLLAAQNRLACSDLVLFSPWLDLSMSNLQIPLFQQCDKLLSLKALKMAALKYARNLSVYDPRISPIYGDFNALCKLHFFSGTHDILFPDIQKCVDMLHDAHLEANLYIYPELFHDWVIVSALPESKDVLEKLKGILQI